MKKQVTVYIIVPAYNEAPVIRRVLSKLPRSYATATHRIRCMIVVVDDGSYDKTAQQAGKIPGVIVLRHPVNMGAGAATRTGLHYARRHRCDLAVTMDADGQHRVSDVKRLINHMLIQPEIDLIIGSRLRSNGNMPVHKKIGNHLLSFMTLLVFGVRIMDSQSGLRAFGRRALDTLEFHTNGYGFCSEMLWQAKRSGLHITEVPITAVYTEYSKSKGQKSYSGALQIFQQIVLRRVLGI